MSPLPPNPLLGAALRTLPEHCTTDALEAVWIFPPRVSGAQESGLAVLVLHDAGPAVDAELRRVWTLRYRGGSGRGRALSEAVWAECGRCPAGRVERVIHGVSHRLGVEAQPTERVAVRGDAAEWARLLEALEPPAA